MNFEKVGFEEYKRELDGEFKGMGTFAEEVYPDIELPERATDGSAGFDFKMPYDIHLPAGAKIRILTGIKCNLKSRLFFWRKFVLKIYPRSGLGMKYGLRESNTVGIIDSDYYGNEGNEGHIMIQITADKDIDLKKGDRFAQGIISRYYTVGDKPSRKRAGGMGSTGK